MDYLTDIVNFFWGGRLLETVAYSKILLFGEALFREGYLLESGRSLDHLRYLTLTLYFEAVTIIMLGIFRFP